MKTVTVAVVVAQHYVVFSVQIVVLAVLGEDQTVQEKIVGCGCGVAEERAPGLAQCFFLRIAQNQEQVLAGAAQHSFLVDLETRKAFAYLHRPGGAQLPRPFVLLDPGAAPFQRQVVLVQQFAALELERSQVEQEIETDIVLRLRPVESNHVQVCELALEFHGIKWFEYAVLQVPHAGGRARSQPSRRQFCHRQLLNVAMFGNQFEDVQPRRIGKFWTQKNIMADVVNAGDQIFQDEQWLVARQRELTGVVRWIPALKERKGHSLAGYSKGENRILYQFSEASYITIGTSTAKP